MTRALARLLRIAAGLALIVLGLLLSLPGVPGPGLLVAGIGFSMLLSVSPRLRRAWLAFTRRHPRWFGWLRRLRARLRHRRRKRNGEDEEASGDPRPPRSAYSGGACSGHEGSSSSAPA